MPLDFNEIRQLLATIAQTDIAEVTLKSDDFELTVRKGVGNQVLSVGQATLGGVVGSGLTSGTIANQTAPTQLPEAATSRDNSVAGGQSPLSVNTPSAKYVEVQSPMVGTFYRAPAPGEAPFVEVGDRVRSGQSVCIIEAMKLMNEIEAEVSGQVMEILVQNGEPVEYGQPLMRINPD
ncbi:acetyl-CoA carboxylase biotin carboxyl carrier protein [Sphaerospermopsis aphanizomenoides BCCUSP55]|uniref:acetyl-CoA carboxylase biotin carboxyl carrier protein n=1 Tax=Sphaerospermopsis aphanizomenoides TaxID=459663 RepID=UPI000B1ACF1C|nr:acetyl-CoA carboxylase biotin carboxyl carrier protein [Sphaerospermopsis aphanizomenoides]MBK1990487.1 acetyl-CoA carboxylase biotin carboxyl carrier protein [Sphaerospermopsis aphanizomenoides BCCUSP55]